MLPSLSAASFFNMFFFEKKCFSHLLPQPFSPFAYLLKGTERQRVKGVENASLGRLSLLSST
jgi:hypothetical protein